MRVTIDTNILVTAFLEHSWDHLSVTVLVRTIGSKVCLDSGSRILTEYRNKLAELELFQKWYTEVSPQFEWYSGKLPKRHANFLSNHGCHEPSDHVFIAVAHRSGKVLFTEDSDMGKGPRGKDPPHDQALAYLEGTLGLTVCDAKEALYFLSRQLGTTA